MTMKIKICGLSRPEDIACVNRLLPDYIGFVFWPKSRRAVTREQTAQLKALLSPLVRAVGVFVEAPLEEIVGLLADGIIDIAQLHGRETETDIRYLQEMTGRPVIKAVKVHERSDVEAWLGSGADYLLFDSGMGSGKAFDRSLLGEVGRPYFLAGGLGPDNLEPVLVQGGPYGVDLSSSVETEGRKDPEKMRRVVELVRQYDRTGNSDRE